MGQTIDKDTTKGQEDAIIIDPVEVMPRFAGGEIELTKYIKHNMKKENISDSVKGRVFVQFVVEKTGEVTDVSVIKGLCEPCDKEAIRVVTSMPKWTPGTQMGKLIRTRMVLPIIF